MPALTTALLSNLSLISPFDIKHYTKITLIYLRYDPERSATLFACPLAVVGAPTHTFVHDPKVCELFLSSDVHRVWPRDCISGGGAKRLRLPFPLLILRGVLTVPFMFPKSCKKCRTILLMGVWREG